MERIDLTAGAEKGGVRQVVIVDASGSMSPHIGDLRDALKEALAEMGPDDIVSIVAFSTDGCARYVLAPSAVPGSEAVENILERIRAGGLTGIAYPLEETRNSLDLTRPVTLSFMTDGYPVPGGAEDEERILAACSALSGMVSRATMYGFGDSYNRDLLLKMASALAGSSRHVETIDEYGKAMAEHHGGGSGNLDRYVDVPEGIETVLAVYAGKVERKPILESDGTRSVRVPDADMTLFMLAANELPKSTDDNAPLFYALAAEKMQQGDNVEALRILGKTGDKRLIDMLMSAFTTAEVGMCQASIEAAASDPGQRWLKGKNRSYVPSRTAFCMLDFLEIMQKDEAAVFYPFHDGWEYKRTTAGRGHLPGEKLPKYSKDVTARFADLVWAKDFLNLSVRFSVPATLEIGPNDYGLEEVIPVTLFKSYAFIADGSKNVESVPASMSEETFATLKARGLISRKITWKEGGIYTLSLKRLPIINRARSEDIDFAALAKDAIEELEEMAMMLCYKYRLGDTESVETFAYTGEQEEYLYRYGVSRKGVWNSLAKVEPSGDVRTARKFELKVAKFSRLPSVDETMKAVAKKGRGGLTPSQAMVHEAMERVNALDVETIPDRKKMLEKLLRERRSRMAAAKMAALLTGRWPFVSREPSDCVMTNGEFEVTFALEEVEIKM